MSSFKVLLLDGIDPAGIELIQQTGSITALVHDKISRQKLLESISEIDGLVVRSATAIDREVIQIATGLKVIGRAGVGVDNVDVNAATEHGVLVMNSPGGSTTTTAEHTIAMLFALARNIPQAYETLKDHQWEKSKFKGVELAGKTLGVIGLGRIGSEVARKCQAIGMKVIAYDPYINTDAHLSSGLALVEIDQIFDQADFITVHVPLTEATRSLINQTTISKMKDGVRLLNCARGGIINEQDLYDAMKSGKVAGAAFDVFETEPNIQSPLLELDNFIATPHLGASTTEAQRKVSEDICRQVCAILIEVKTDVESHPVTGTGLTDELPRIVNVDGYALEVVPRGHMIYFTNKDKAGVISGIGAVLGKGDVNTAGMDLRRERQGGRA